MLYPGEVTEWSIVLVSKTSRDASPSGVRISPSPLRFDGSSQRIAETSVPNDMDGCPGEPGHEAGHPNPAGLQDRVAFADDGHIGLVEVAKRCRVPLRSDRFQPHPNDA